MDAFVMMTLCCWSQAATLQSQLSEPTWPQEQPPRHYGSRWRQSCIAACQRYSGLLAAACPLLLWV